MTFQDLSGPKILSSEHTLNKINSSWTVRLNLEDQKMDRVSVIQMPDNDKYFLAFEGEGVRKSPNFCDALYGCPLSREICDK